MKNLRLLAIAFAGLPGLASAVPITITGYDITNSGTSGYGGWAHAYTGTITPTGASGFFAGGVLADYSGGTGTMADGLDSNDVSDTHLFAVSDVPTITVFLDGFYSINSIELWQGDFGNAIPGGIETIDVSMLGTTDTLSGSPFSTPGSLFSNTNDRFDVGGSLLDGLVTDRLVLSAISEGNCCGGFSISEIRIDGNVAAVPEPTSLSLLGMGLLGFGYWRRRRA